MMADVLLAFSVCRGQRGEPLGFAQQLLLRQGKIDRITVRLAPCSAGWPVYLDHIACGIVEVECERDAVVESKLDREVALCHFAIAFAQFRERAHLECGVRELTVPEDRQVMA